MALNYSHISKDNLVSPVRIVNGYLVEGVSENENNGEVYSRTWHVNQLEADELNFSCGRDRVDCCSSLESTSEDIVDLLPSDPFGMDMETFTALSGLLQDCGGYMRSNNCQEGYGLFAEWNFIWNNAFKFQQIPYTIQLNERLNTFSNNLQVNEKPGTCSDYFPRGFQFDQKIHTTHTWSIYEDERALGTIMWEMLASGDVGFFNGSASCSFDMRSTGEADGASEIEGAPHEAFNYVLSYLDVKDLLSVERVCSSLSTAVRGDPLFWKTIHIDQPLNERINDDVLVQLASRAQGKLECLNLVECPKVTDDGLRRVLEANRRLTKLCVPGCTRISIECIMNCIRAYNCNNEFGGIKHVRIGGLFGVNYNHFKELNLLLGSRDKKIERHHKLHFYHRGNFYLPYDDDRTIDIEMCSRCEKFRLVYDCPSEGCKAKDKSPQVCRACTLCIGRCAQCGRCINNTEFVETFCLELLCSDCFKQPHKNQDRPDMKAVNYLELNVV